MTRKIKNTLLITLTGFFLAIVGLTLFSSSASLRKTNADEVSADNTVETLIFSCSTEEELLNAAEGHEECGTTGSISDFTNAIMFASSPGKVNHFFIKIPFRYYEQCKSFCFSFCFNSDQMSQSTWFTRCFYVKYTENGEDKFLNVDTIKPESERYLVNYRQGDEESVDYKFYLSKDELDLNSCPCTPSYLCFGIAIKPENASTIYSTLSYFNMYGVSLPTNTVDVMYGNQVKKSYTVEQGSIITADTLRKDLDRSSEGYELIGLSFTADGEAAQLTDLTVTSDMILYAVYDKTDDVDVEESNFGDKISDVANNVSSWLKDNTGVAISSGSLIIAAIVVVLFMLTKRK